MLILEYISTHGTPEWCAARMSARESKGPLPAYEQLCTKHVMSKVRVAYNNVFRLLFGYRRSCSASEMFVYNNIYNFEGRLGKNINDFTMRIGSSSNVLIATLRENSFILAGPLRQKWITSVYTIYN